MGSTGAGPRPARNDPGRLIKKAPRTRRTHPARPWRLRTPEASGGCCARNAVSAGGIRCCPDPRHGGAAATATVRIVCAKRMAEILLAVHRKTRRRWRGLGKVLRVFKHGPNGFH